jgi:hypothetical protein
MSTELTTVQRIERLENIVKAIIDGAGLVRPGEMRTPADNVDELLKFSARIKEEQAEP